MSSFTAMPSVTPLGNGRWRNEQDFWFYFSLDETKSIFVPKGFIHNFASIPKIFRVFFDPADLRWAKAAIFHDYLYSFKVVNPVTGKPFTRNEADYLFFEGCLILGTPPWIANAFYAIIMMRGRQRWQKLATADNRYRI